ncbi:MAG: membrane protein insertase YidC [Candidatus Zixiibacteriota bacterium]|nr:MAG: membrane protein insertase YidC [candidate division Zixibacteria bacterium]
MDKKVILLVVALGILVIFWIPIMTKLGFIKPAERPAPTEQVRQEQQQPPPQPQAEQPAQVTQQQAAAQPTEIGEPTSLDTLPQVLEDKILIETNVFEVALSNYGGAPVPIKLKVYEYNDNGLIEMLPDNQIATPELKFNGGTVNANRFVYSSSLSRGRHPISSGSIQLTYTYQNEAGAQIVKRYRFYADRYDYDLILEVSDPTSFGFERKYALEWNNKLGPTELNLQDDYNSMWAMALQVGERVKFDKYQDDRFSRTDDGTTNWIATRSKYFASIMVPRSRTSIGARSSGVKNRIAVGDESVQTRELAIGLLMEPPYNEPMADSFSVYVGPMDYEKLKAFNESVVDLIDIGTTPFVGWIIKIFAIPIIWLLPRMYSIIPNYGFVIILFSLIIKLITWPLSKKTVKSMSAMKALQPKMQELKEKHKNNPQALNREMMKLYKEAGINPMSGCLPYLPQLPLFFALFAVFRSTILLRQAPFILWWDDLSRGALSMTDPYILLVILMVVLMFVQQKMTMTDPKNKALIYIFPLMLGFFFYKASAGLVLYWTCFSLFSFVEQIVFKRSQPAPAEGEAEPVKARKKLTYEKKKSGGSKP